jgi:hypothetical protein
MNHWNGPKAGLPDTVDHARCLAFVKGIQTYHMTTHGWADIGYNGLICQHGRAIEGRGLDVQGAHCPNYNVTAYGVMFLIGETETATPAALARQRALYDACATRSGRALTKLGHRDGLATDCPGDALYAWVKAGMPAPQKEMFTVGQYEDIMAAVAAVKADVATLATKVATTAAVTALSGTVTTAHADDVTRLDALAGRIDGIGDVVAEQVSAATIQALDDSLGGVEVTARYVRQRGAGS